MNVSKITDKFYKTEEERIQKLEAHKDHIEEFVRVLGDEIKVLKKQKIQFYVVNMDFSNTPILHAMMIPCCGANIKEIPNKTRKSFEEKIISQTEFRRVIWEL